MAKALALPRIRLAAGASHGRPSAALGHARSGPRYRARAYPWSWMLHSDARDGAAKKPDAESIQKLLEKNC